MAHGRLGMITKIGTRRISGTVLRSSVTVTAPPRQWQPPLLKVCALTGGGNSVRGFSTLEVAPAISAAGLPEAMAFSIQAGAQSPQNGPSVQLSNIGEGTRTLRQQAEGGPVVPAEIQPVVDQTLQYVSDASWEEIAELAETFVKLRLRLPLRDMIPAVTAKVMNSEAAALPSVIRIMSATGKASLYFSELFDFCNEHLHSLAASDLATYVYESGRHGLRTRHFMETAGNRAVDLVPQMNLTDIMRAWQGFVRFSRDRKGYYIAAEPLVRKQISGLTVHQLILALRVSKDLKHIAGFVDLHTACATELMKRMDHLGLPDTAQCLLQCTFSPKYRVQAQGLVRSIEQKWSRAEDLNPLRIVEVVDALETFASWGMKPLSLINRLDRILVERQVELKYAGNVSLWINATQAFSRMEHLDAHWPIVGLELARDKTFLERVSFFQQSAFVVCLGRLRLFDETVFRNVAELLISDFRLFKEPQDIAPVLWSYATVQYFHPQLFDTAYDLMIEWFEGELIDLTRQQTHTSLVQAVWSFALAGYHMRYESFAAYLDYAFFKEIADMRPIQLRRLAQIADAVLEEAPGMAKLCQYPERVAEARTNQRVRSIVASDPVSSPELLQDVRTTLTELGWPHEVFFMPDNTSAFYVDISLAQKFGQKVGLLMGGKYEMLRVGLPSEEQLPRESGFFVLARRLLEHRGWKTIVVTHGTWAALDGNSQRKAFLEKAIEETLKCSTSAPPTTAPVNMSL